MTTARSLRFPYGVKSGALAIGFLALIAAKASAMDLCDDPSTGTALPTPTTPSGLSLEGPAGLTVEGSEDEPGSSKTDSRISTFAPWTQYLSVSRPEHANWAQAVRRSRMTVTALSSLLESGDVIHTTWDLSAREQQIVDSYLDRFDTDRGAAWKADFRSKVLRIADREKLSGRRVIWHIGNEINSRWFSQALRTREGATLCEQNSNRPDGCFNDPQYIPLFAEYYVAPHAEILRELESATGSGSYIALGSVINLTSAQTDTWLKDLMCHELSGIVAPSLSGKRIYEVVDYLTFHYTFEQDRWEDGLESALTWQTSGAVRGAIDTEEIGKRSIDRGEGSIYALRILSRAMAWVAKHGLTPNQFRLNFWGQGEPHNSPDLAMATLYEQIGPSRLALIEWPEADSGPMEPRLFALEDGGWLLTLAWRKRDESGNWADDLVLPVDMGAADPESMFVFTPQGKRTKPVTVDHTSEGKSRLRGLSFEGPFAAFAVFQPTP